VTQQVKVGVGVFVKRNSDGKILLQKRSGSHGQGTWGLPGGHLEFSEEIEACAKREVLEEVGIVVKNIRVVGFTNDVMKEENKHYVTIFVESELIDGEEPKIMEPQKTTELGWFDENKLPAPLFLPLKNFLEGKCYSVIKIK